MVQKTLAGREGNGSPQTLLVRAIFECTSNQLYVGTAIGRDSHPLSGNTRLSKSGSRYPGEVNPSGRQVAVPRISPPC